MKNSNFFFNSTSQNAWKALLILLVGFAFTLAATYNIKNEVEKDAKNELKSICNDIQIKISTRLYAHALLLRSASALFAASDYVSRNDWKEFYKQSLIDKNLPGIQGLGFSIIINKNELQQHIQKIRKEGFPNYNLRPVGDRSIYTSIIYLEPFADRNLRAFGFDMFSEPVRRKAMEIARDSNIAMISGKVVLVQETNEDIQAGSLMFVPVYKQNMPINTVDQRREAIIGWVYSPYRMNDLMVGILGRWDLIHQDRIRLQIFDGDQISKNALLFDSQRKDTIINQNIKFRKVTIPIIINGKKWTLQFMQTNETNYILKGRELLVFISGIIISILLFILTLLLLNTRLRAQKIADRLTSELKDGRERFETLLNSTAQAIYGIDLDGCCTFANNSCIQLLGYKSYSQLSGKNMHDLIHHTCVDGSNFEVKDCKIFQAYINEVGTHVDDEVLWRADGKCFPAEYWSYPVFLNGKINGAVVTFFDITERKHAEMVIATMSKRNEMLFNNASEGIHVLDENGNVVEANLAFCRMLGYSPEEMLLLNIAEWDIQWNKSELLARIVEIIKNPAVFETQHRRKDGSIIDVEISGIGIFLDGKYYLYASARDITAQKHSEEALKQIRINYETFFNTIDDFLFVLDEQGNIIHTNSTVTRRLEYTDEELSGLSVLMVHPADRREEAGRIVGEMLEGKTEFCPVPIVTKSGKQIPVETRVSKGFWDGKPVIFGVTKDISQIHLSEEKFSKLFYLNPSACGLSDLNTGKYIEVNNVFYTLLGFEKGEVIGKTAMELNILPFKTREEILQKSDSNGNVHNVETELLTKNGEIKYVLLSAESILVQDQKFRFTVVHDITAYKLAEEALQQSSKKLEAIILASPDGIGMVALDAKLQLASDKLAEMYGFSSEGKEEFIGRSIFEFIDPSYHNLLTENTRNLILKRGEQRITEYLAVKKDGTRFYVDVNSTLMLDSNGNPESILFIERDVTERKQSENEIKQASTRLSLAARAGGVGIWDFDLVNNILLWDDQMFALYGIKKDSFDGAYRAWLTGLHPDDLERRNKEHQMALSGEKEFDTEFRVIWPDGSIHNIRANAIVQRDENGKPLHMIGTNWDITEQKKTEEALIKAKQDADLANNAKSEFLANMSHEIRTPMNAILGFSEALYHKLESKQHKNMIKSVLSSGNLLMSLLNDILDLSKIEAGKLDILLQPVNLKYLLQEILLLFKDKANSKNLELKYNVEPDFPTGVMLDEIRIKQVLFNLVGNAIKFTPAGYVHINLSYTKTNENKGQIQINVEDSGIGIPDSQKQVIFEAFKQQTGQSNRQYGGTGLGLAISKRLVERMNGNISVTSHVNKGSNFKLIFEGVEINNTEIRKKEYFEEIQNITFENANILIIDDVVSNIETVENLLSSSGLTTLSAENGEMALEILKYTSIDLILLDMRMPIMDGYEVANLIKKDPKLKHIPIIAFTASLMSSEKIENSSDFDGFLYKPVKKIELYNQFSRFLKYSTDIQLIKTEKAKVSNLKDLPKEIVSKLPEIVKILEDNFKPKWESIKNSLVLFKIEAFAIELHDMANEYNFRFLIDYANQIKDAVEIIDLESLIITLHEFPDIIIKIAQLIPKD